MADSSEEFTRLDLRPRPAAGTDPLQAGTAKLKGKSVRVNLMWPPVPTCLKLAGLKLLRVLERRAWCAQVIEA